jgi:hypothetical protein
MSKLRMFGLVVAGFTAGLGFVIACDDDPIVVDAGRADARADFEPPITADRIYNVTHESAATFQAPGSGTTLLQSAAQCNPGDVVISGSCYVYDDPAPNDYNALGRGESTIVAQGVQPAVGDLPAQPDRYRCVYTASGFPRKVYATATCFKLAK